MLQQLTKIILHTLNALSLQIYFPMMAAIQSQVYRYAFLKHITILVTTIHKSHIMYLKFLVTVNMFNRSSDIVQSICIYPIYKKGSRLCTV